MCSVLQKENTWNLTIVLWYVMTVTLICLHMLTCGWKQTELLITWFQSWLLAVGLILFNSCWTCIFCWEVILALGWDMTNKWVMQNVLIIRLFDAECSSALTYHISTHSKNTLFLLRVLIQFVISRAMETLDCTVVYYYGNNKIDYKATANWVRSE